MKKEIHPEYHSKAKVSCACGNVFYVGSTKKEMEIEICYACHPFYTGKEKLIDTAGRVEKFKAKRAKAEGKTVRTKKEKRAVKAKKKVAKTTVKKSGSATSKTKKESSNKKGQPKNAADKKK